MYIYPDNLTGKATLFLWALPDVVVIGVGALISVFALAQLNFMVPIILTATYAFLSIRFDDTCILDFLKYASAFLFRKPQTFYWKPAKTLDLEDEE
ncbi:MAG: hypothetical protein R3Y63_13140 [Eubacteriales bacterium]